VRSAPDRADQSADQSADEVALREHENGQGGGSPAPPSAPGHSHNNQDPQAPRRPGTTRPAPEDNTKIFSSLLDELLRPDGLTALQYTALTVLERHPDMSVAQLARNSFVTAQSMADILAPGQFRLP
jgi:hypothetical protein